MQRTLVLFLGLLMGGTVYAQSPVSWKFNAVKKADKTYELHFTATVSAPWHIYSQNTPDGGPLPTQFNFAKNPLITLEGKTKENGKVVKKHEAVFDIDVIYFDGGVDFVQVVKLKGKAFTNFTGTIEYMACNDEQCLPPNTVKFSIPLK